LAITHKLEPENGRCKEENINSKILDNFSEWTIYICNNKYSIQTIVDSKSGEGWNNRIHAFGNCTSKEDLEEILEIYSTLKRKTP